MTKQIEAIGKFKMRIRHEANLGTAAVSANTSWGGVKGQIIKWKVKSLFLVCLMVLCLYNAQTAFAQVGIGTTTPDASAILDLTSTTKGILISRVTMVQRNAIVSPATALMVYQTDNTPGYYYNSGTPGAPTWVRVFSGSSAGGWDLSGNSGTTIGTHFLGTTDVQDFAIYTNNTEKLRVTSAGNVGIGTTAPTRKFTATNTYSGYAAAGFYFTGDFGQFTIRNDVSNADLAYLDFHSGGNISWSQGILGKTFVISSGGGANRTTLHSNKWFAITDAGNVGIGTTNPSSKFQVNGMNADIALSSSDINLVAFLSSSNRSSSRQALYFNHDGSNVFNDLYIGSAFEVVDGVSIAAPTFKHAGSTSVNANFLKVGSDGFFFQQGGTGAIGASFTPTTAMTIDNSGNVGIGTTAPSEELYVRKDQNGLTSIILDNQTDDTQAASLITTQSKKTAGNFSLWLGSLSEAYDPTNLGADAPGNHVLYTAGSGSSLLIATRAAKNIQFYTGSGLLNSTSERMRIDASGNVGIGTTSPSARLEVSSTTSGVLIPRVTLVQRNAIAIPVTSELVFQTDNTPGYYYWDGAAWVQMLTASGTGSGWATTGNAGTTVGTNFLGTTDAQDFAIYTNNAERIRVTSGGNIGIGTTSPDFSGFGAGHQVLSLLSNTVAKVSAIEVAGNQRLAGTDAGAIDFHNFDGVSFDRLAVVAGRVDASANSGNLVFKTANAGVIGDRMLIDESGNVGIGTTSPDANLEVAALESGSNSAKINLENSTSGFKWQLANRSAAATASDALAISHWNGSTWLSNYLIVKPSGNVGIGTVAPGARLEVTPTITATTDYTGIKSGIVYNGVTVMTNWYGGYIAAPSGTGTITNKYAFVTEANAGNVGIGTNAPSVKLQVDHVGNENAAFQVGDLATVTSRTGVYLRSTTEGRISVGSGAAITFYNGGSAGTERMRIDGAGNVGINTTTPDASAILDVVSTSKGTLLSRMTTAQRDAIASPANSLLIYNTTTECYEGYYAATTTWVAFGCIGCTVPTTVTASAAPNPICAGSTLTLTGGATDSLSWQWTGPNSYTSSSQSPTIASITTAGAGIYTLTASNTCGSAVSVSTASVVVSATPTTAAAGSDINTACGVTTATLAGNTPTEGTGAWSLISGTATITTPSSPTSGVTGLVAAGTATLRWTISNAPCAASTDDIVITTTSCCGSSFTDARDGKTYNTVLIGTQCWMAENLNYGNYVPVTSPQVSGDKFCQNLSGANDPACPMGGLYEWANMMQGSGTCNGTGAPPNDGCITVVQGLCPSGWHVPSHYEWTSLEKNVGSNPGAFPYDVTTVGWLGTDEGGNLKQTGTANWTTPNTGATNSSSFTALPGGFSSSGSFTGVGTLGYWWSSTEKSGTDAWSRYLNYTMASSYRNGNDKLIGFSMRCIQD
ncbi:MAG: hypothetical protein JKY52_20945 [Flavobacteriales bacterium]|nr:hypothetical protein [Flavobacteriales bacterium]